MAIIKPSAIISEISGSVGEVTFTRNRYGAIAKARTAPEQTESTLRDAAQADISYLSKYWAGTLTEPQRAAWRDYADKLILSSRVGLERRTAGFHQFVRVNSMSYARNATILKVAPPTPGTLQIKSLSLCLTDLPMNQHLIVFNESLMGSKSVSSIAQLSVGKFVSKGQNRYFSPWRILAYGIWNGVNWTNVGVPVSLPEWCGSAGRLWGKLKIQDYNSGHISQEISTFIDHT